MENGDKLHTKRMKIGEYGVWIVDEGVLVWAILNLAADYNSDFKWMRIFDRKRIELFWQNLNLLEAVNELSSSVKTYLEKCFLFKSYMFAICWFSLDN